VRSLLIRRSRQTVQGPSLLASPRIVPRRPRGTLRQTSPPLGLFPRLHVGVLRMSSFHPKESPYKAITVRGYGALRSAKTAVSCSLRIARTPRSSWLPRAPSARHFSPAQHPLYHLDHKATWARRS